LPGATRKTSYAGAGSGGETSRGELIAKIGTILSAIMASSCCWLPVLLLAVGVSGAGIATALEAYRPIFMVITFGFLAMAFYFTYRTRPVRAGSIDCCAPQPAAVASELQRADSGCCAEPMNELAGDPVIAAKRRFNMMAINKGMLWVVTALAVLFLFFPQLVTGLVGSGNDEIKQDMTRSMIIIEGMTCEG
jgi:MerT mercuric transport protein